MFLILVRDFVVIFENVQVQQKIISVFFLIYTNVRLDATHTPFIDRTHSKITIIFIL